VSSGSPVPLLLSRGGRALGGVRPQRVIHWSIGFLNFGQIDRLIVQAPIETFGTGARGFNLYRRHLAPRLV
jgi:hypothetical protein